MNRLRCSAAREPFIERQTEKEDSNTGVAVQFLSFFCHDEQLATVARCDKMKGHTDTHEYTTKQKPNIMTLLAHTLPVD